MPSARTCAIQIRLRLLLAAVTTFATLFATESAAQSVATSLSDLLTVQGPAPPGFTRDLPAAEATRDSVAGLLLVEMTTLPLLSSTGGFIYRLDQSRGTVERVSESFGPFFTERALRSGRGQLAFGLTYQNSGFNTLQGADLGDGTFPTNISRSASNLQMLSVDTLSLDLDVSAVTGFAQYGVNDRLDVGVLVPVLRVRFSGVRQNTLAGQPSFSISASESASGLGDMAFTARYQLLGRDRVRVAVGGDLRLPTGSSDNLLGSGNTGVRGIVATTLEQGKVAAHLNGGVGAGGASDELFWNTGLTLAVVPRVTVVGEVFGRYFGDLHRLAQVYQPHPVLAGVETMRWLPEDGGVSNSYAAFGAKWNVTGGVVLNAGLLAQLADGGLRARATPTVSLDYTFQR